VVGCTGLTLNLFIVSVFAKRARVGVTAMLLQIASIDCVSGTLILIKEIVSFCRNKRDQIYIILK